MRQFLKRALQKVDTLKPEQIRDLILSASKEIGRLETVMDSLIRGVLVCDTANNLILANKAARRFLSIVSYEQGREKIWSVISEEDVANFLNQTLLSKDKAEEREFDVEVVGVKRLLGMSVMPLVQDHQVSGSLILVDDITERRLRDAKMRRMENLASLTTLAATVAHEIKNPLGALSIHVQLIQKEISAHGKSGNVKIDKYLKVINEEIDRLNAIVVDFLFAVRPLNAKLRRGSINDFIIEMIDFVALELKAAGIEVILNLAENLPPVDFDSGLMKMAILNLIKNAIAAMSWGGKLKITTEDTETDLLISIADTGTGISEEDLSKIFDPYFTTKNNGTGLGLTVVFKVVKEHQGDINVVSREGEGSVFTISLPIPQIEKRLIAYNGEPVPVETTVSAETEVSEGTAVLS